MNDSSENESPKRRSIRKRKPPDKLGFEAEDLEVTGSRMRNRSGKLSELSSSDFVTKAKSIEDDLSDIESESHKPTELYTDKEDLRGASIYKFPTPSKRGAMAQKADLNRRKQAIATVKPTGLTSSESESESVSEDEDVYVPSEDEEENLDEKDSSDEAEITLGKGKESYSESKKEREETGKSSPVKNIHSLRPRRSTRIDYKDYNWKTDEYFEMQSSRALTSDRTLGRLANPRIDEEKLQILLTKQNHVSKDHKKAIKTLSEDYRTSFPMWYYTMEEGYSLLFHGLGSKRTIIEDFRKEILNDHPTLVVNGFFPGLTIKEILNGIIINLLGIERPPNPNQCLNLIEKILKDNPDDRMYLIVHNIDGPMLRSSKAQDALSQLASIPNLSLIASIDHINAPLIWDSVKHSRYNFFWCDVTTFLPYDVETSFQSSVMVKRNETLAFSSLVNVFLSLTNKARAIYVILAKYQIEHANEKAYPGMAFKDLYRNARDAFLGNSDVTLRTHLKEFLDHKLVRSKRNIDGAEYLNIPLDNSLLKQFIEQYENAE